MHAHHKRLLAELEKHQRKRAHSQANDSYLGSGHLYYDVSIPTLRTLAKAWLKENKRIPDGGFIPILASLYRGRSYEEKVLASILLGYHDTGRKKVRTTQLDAWLDGLVGWAEIDSLCQSTFTAEEILGNWREWERFIRRLAHDRNINKRRAALVFLSTPTRRSEDARLAALAFEMIERLKPEREIIITKAVSWLLRSMLQNHKRAVAAYIKGNRNSLPSVAVRETTRKIATGRK
jgi:3-methyladenine DNA glycosylase AlkD